MSEQGTLKPSNPTPPPTAERKGAPPPFDPENFKKLTTIPKDNGSLSYRDDGVVKGKVYSAVLAFCKRHECYSSESFAQRDAPQIGICDLMDEIFDVMEFNREYTE